MKKSILVIIGFFLVFSLFSGNVEKSFNFGNYVIKTNGSYKTFNFEGTKLSGIPGEPVFPYQAVSILLPPGEVAVSIEIVGESETMVPGSLLLYPQQLPQPISKGLTKEFIINLKGRSNRIIIFVLIFL